MKTQLITLMILLNALVINTLFANDLKEDSYEGKITGTKTSVHLILKKINGRDGSFFGLLIQPMNKMALYIIDKTSAASGYAMTPLTITDDGEIGHINDDPSLTISSFTEKGKTKFRIINSGSENNLGFNGPMVFEGKKSGLKWIDLESGAYTQEKGTSIWHKNKNALFISNYDSIEREASAIFQSGAIHGSFILREKFSLMYLVNQNRTLATGTERNQNPNGIGIFIKRKFQKAEFILIDPKNSSGLTIFEQN